MSAPAIVIGAGANELVAAHTLARAGYRVVMLDRHSAHEAPSADLGWVAPRIVRDLALDRQGLTIHRPDPWAAAPLPDGGRLELWQEMARSVEAIRHVSARDAERWPAFCERMRRLARLLETLYSAPPPGPVGRGFSDLVQFAGLGLRIRGLGRQGIEDLLRFLPMSVADLLDDWFESDALKGILGAAGVMHYAKGPRAAGTAFRLLHHHAGSPAGVFRPPASNVCRVLRALGGIEIRREANPARIEVRENRVTGVVLASGEEIAASLVVSGADPRRTMLDWVDPGWLDPQFVRALTHLRCRGVAARVTLALDRPAAFTTLVIAPSLEYLERASDDAKYGRVSRAPYLEARRSDGGAEVHVQYAPYALADGEWDEARRTALGDSVLGLLSRELASSVVERTVLSPRDLEEREGFPEGQADHAELSLDQALWMRPVPGWARYRMPVKGLYLCGPGTHPGAGIAGAAGLNCAREVLRDLRSRGA